MIYFIYRVSSVVSLAKRSRPREINSEGKDQFAQGFLIAGADLPIGRPKPDCKLPLAITTSDVSTSTLADQLRGTRNHPITDRKASCSCRDNYANAAYTLDVFIIAFARAKFQPLLRPDIKLLLN